MSGLEVVVAIAGIVGAFNGSVTLYRSWRDAKRERREKEENRRLERSLTVGSTTVQQEYDTHFARLGQRFAIGDDRARAELSQYVIKLQHTIITLMTESSSAGTIILPSLPIMLSSSEDTRKGVVTTLGEQYQRMLQAKPLQATMSAGVGRGTSPPQKKFFFAKPAEKTNSGGGMYAALKQSLLPTATESGIHMGRAAVASQNKSFFAIAARSESKRMPIPQSSSQKHPITKVLPWQPSVHPNESVPCVGTLVRKGLYLECLDCQHNREASQLAFILMINDDGLMMGIPMIFITSTCHKYARGPDKYMCPASCPFTCEFIWDLTSHLRDRHTPREVIEAFPWLYHTCFCDAGNNPRALERVRGHEVSCAVRVRCLEEAEICGVDADFVLSQ